MSGNAINNANLTNLNRDMDTTGFVPRIAFVVDIAAKEVDVTDNSTFPAGIGIKKAIIHVHDKFGNEARGYIDSTVGSDSGHDHETTVDCRDLDFSKGIDITATVLGDDDKLTADGGAYNVAASGELSSWDIQKNA